MLSPLTGGDGTFMLDSGLSKVSVMELVHNGFLYPRETKAVSQPQLSLASMHFLHMSHGNVFCIYKP